jgi:ribose transport system substrate-binding protein
LRLLGKQDLPRVVSTPQALITKDNVETFAVKGDALRQVLLAQPAD